MRRTVRPGDLAPDDADLGSPDFLLGAVDVGDLLSGVETRQEISTLLRNPTIAKTYVAALVSSTPSIFTRLVPE